MWPILGGSVQSVRSRRIMKASKARLSGGHESNRQSTELVRLPQSFRRLLEWTRFRAHSFRRIARNGLRTRRRRNTPSTRTNPWTALNAPWFYCNQARIVDLLASSQRGFWPGQIKEKRREAAEAGLEVGFRPVGLIAASREQSRSIETSWSQQWGSLIRELVDMALALDLVDHVRLDRNQFQPRLSRPFCLLMGRFRILEVEPAG